jgi:hypothetical protein
VVDSNLQETSMTTMKSGISLFALAGFLILGASPVMAQQAAGPAAMQAQPEQGRVVLPRDLMTAQDRQAYRQEMRQARTVQERNLIREQRMAQLRQRAGERGLALAEPAMRGPGMGSGEGGGSQHEPMARGLPDGMGMVMPRAP